VAYRAILFDFEGTLVDFQWKLTEGEAALRAGFAAQGFEATELAGLSYSGMWNLAAAAAAQRADLDELRGRLGPVYDEYDLDALSRWRLRPGALELLGASRERGLRIGIVSNIGRLALGQALERFLLDDLFDLVVSRDEVRLMKPAPEGIQVCLSAWDLPPEAVLFVGDSLTDIRAARAAGLKVAVIAGGESSPEDLRANPPDFYPRSLADVEVLLA
jgi:HAD superfamily hydrolase (TIGR01509 family)